MQLLFRNNQTGEPGFYAVFTSAYPCGVVDGAFVAGGKSVAYLTADKRWHLCEDFRPDFTERVYDLIVVMPQ